MATIEIANHFQITGRGSVATCHILDGVLKKGMRVVTGHADPSHLTISDIGYADVASPREVRIGLRFDEGPSLELLRELLPVGATIEVIDYGHVPGTPRG